MPRKPRLYVSGIPCHVIQRGNNRGPCFHADRDRRLYLRWLKEACIKFECSVHAYVLMTNHVHLLMTPQWFASVSLAMQSVGRRYVRYFNGIYERSGTLWEGRYKASLVESQSYFLACTRYIELNPVRAGVVARPGDYRWSSHGRNAHGRHDALISDHPEYVRLGDTPAERQSVYRGMFHEGGESVEAAAIREATNLGVPLGSDRFKSAVERLLGREISYRRPGRPEKVRSGAPPT